jgi:hypothetical protein
MGMLVIELCVAVVIFRQRTHPSELLLGPFFLKTTATQAPIGHL